ncbi:MAG: hypothetical protein P8X39_02915, partial [Desulfofustis sp.]
MNEVPFARLPGYGRLLSLYRSKGDGYILAWGQRISGLLLVFYVLLHINTLASLTDPEAFASKAQMFSSPVFVFAEWLLALPVIFHCLNGSRLLFYELFTTRFDRSLRGWVYLLTLTYMILLGHLMIRGNQQVSAHLFWLLVLLGAGFISFILVDRIRNGPGSFSWKLHRITAAMLFLLVPAHMLFMHLNPEVGRNVSIIVERMGQPLILVVDALLLCC